MIRLENISKAFGDKRVLEDISADFSTGGTVCILGVSGSGKTTLMRIISGLEKPDSGTVSGIEGLRCSFVFQENRLLPWLTLVQNLCAVGVSRESALEYLKKVGLSGEEGSYPGQLSGGMARRAALARALAYSGDVIFLDEPFAGLDAQTKSDMIQLLKSELSGKTAFVVTHDTADAQLLEAETFTLGNNQSLG
ncbi:MAG: ATP-binding cassette domain-containing protein [Clostridiales bacterium]|jgi:ABC-type nitrate/sulfonate/bicarbonate transport system ATPase subunit|nr:ATP-binding cassette domain-containing protein [Clostridiales bacterium]